MSTDQKTIDAYNKHAKSWADSKQNIKDSISIFHVFLEKPALYGKLPDLKGKFVLCVGCGSGEEVEHLNSLGAKKVVGIDISLGLIEIAKKNYPNLEYHTMDAENLDFPKETFDLVIKKRC
jgi:2-polyprenyl-3-methyl-5-hydroxy-6-metoxy-1,4-benzoquinol methylase